MATEVKKGEIVVSDRVSDWISDSQVSQRIGDALAGWMDPKQFLAQILIALSQPGKDGKPGPKDCTPMSKFEAAHKCASLQLLPTLDQVAFIPFEKGRGSGIFECTIMPQWQGYKALMERHPSVQEVQAEIVFAGEKYKRDAETWQFIHDFDPFVNRDVFEDLSNIRGSYLRVTYNDGRQPKFHFVTLETIKRARSTAKTQMIWKPYPGEMTLKTTYRNGYARRVVPMDPLVNRKMELLLQDEDRIHQNDPSRAKSIMPPMKSLDAITSQIYQDDHHEEESNSGDNNSVNSVGMTQAEMDEITRLENLEASNYQ